MEGTLAALEIVADRDTRQPMGWTEVAIVAGEVRRRHGVIVRPYGHNLVLAPPLVIDDQAVADFLVNLPAALDEVLQQTAGPTTSATTVRSQP